MKNYIVIAPFPPPITGQSKVTQAVVEAILESPQTCLNVGKSSLESGAFSLSRVLDYLKLFLKFLLLKKDKNTIVYHSIAESFLGNMRDLFIYLLNFRRLNRHYIHMLGGTGMREIISSNTLQGKINRFFIKRLAGVIVEGSLNKSYFEKVITSSKIHVIPNFVESYIFSDEATIKNKYNFHQTDKVNILYLSNLLPGKGYEELAKAFIELDQDIKTNYNLSFVGGFESKSDEDNFLSLIADINEISYLGKFIDHQAKKELYNKTHVFCLPTYYPYEGLPIAILEAYAAGCAVITTNHSGIPDVFKDQYNGFLVDKKSISSLSNCLESLYENKDKLMMFALNNKNQASEMYRIEQFSNKFKQAISKN